MNKKTIIILNCVLQAGLLFLCDCKKRSVFDELAISIEKGSKKEIKTFLSNGGNIDIHGADGSTLLHAAIWERRDDLVEYLVKNGARVDLKNAFGEDAQFFSALYGSVRSLKIVLQKRATKNKYGRAGSSILHATTLSGEIEKIRYVISMQDNINVKNNFGMTPLAVAVRKNYVPPIELLLKCGANPTLRDRKGKTPIDYATSLRNKNLIQVLSLPQPKNRSCHPKKPSNPKYKKMKPNNDRPRP